MDSGDYALIVAFVAIVGNFALGMYSFITVKRLKSRFNFLTEDKILPIVIKRKHSTHTTNDDEKVVVEVEESDGSEFHDVELNENKQDDKEEKKSTGGKRYSLWPLY